MGIAYRAVAVLVLSLALVATLAASALGRGAKAGQRDGSRLELVMLDSTDGVPHYGQHVTFTVSTTVTEKPFVRLDCYQGDTWVYWNSAGFYHDYMWTQTFTLSSGYWLSGPADCTATLYHWDGRHFRDITSLNFAVAA